MSGAGIYIASKTKHAERWRKLRDVYGYPINSTWLDEAGPGESASLSDLWLRCIREASAASALVIYCEKDEVLKGAWIELGAALHAGVQIYAVGIEGFTVAHHPAIRHFPTMKDAMTAVKKDGHALATLRPAPPMPPDTPVPGEMRMSLAELPDRVVFRPCPACDGEGGHEEWRWNSRWAVDPGYGVWIACEACNGGGEEEGEAEARTFEDMDDEDGAGAAFIEGERQQELEAAQRRQWEAEQWERENRR